MRTGVCRRQALSPAIKRWGLGLLLFISCWGSGCAPLIMPPTPVASSVEAEDVHLIVQVTYPTVAVLNALASELDVWEVDRAAQTFVARITMTQYEALLQQKLLVTLDCAKMQQYAQASNLTTAAVAQLMQEQCP